MRAGLVEPLVRFDVDPSDVDDRSVTTAWGPHALAVLEGPAPRKRSTFVLATRQLTVVSESDGGYAVSWPKTGAEVVLSNP